MKRIDEKVSSEVGNPPPLPYACAPSAWTLECSETSAFRIPLCGLLVGRSQQCDLVLDDPDASRRHAQLLLLDATPWIVDLGSANGTLVDGHNARRERLPEGAEIILGRTSLKLRAAKKGDLVLPIHLLEAWNHWENGSILPRTERLRRLSGAESCAWVDGSQPVFHWLENGQWEDLGPVRRTLLQEIIG